MSATERGALLDAIRDEPDNDDLLRVYGDWLDDHGEPARAEYIRARLRLGTLAEDSPETAPLVRRIRSLWYKYGKPWRAGLPPSVGRDIAGRGVVTAATLPAAQFLRYGEEIVRREPLAALRLTAAARHVAALAECPALAVIRQLTLTEAPLGERGVAALGNSPHLANLRALRLTQCGIDARAAEALAAAPALAGLRSLDLGFYERNGTDDNAFWRDLAQVRGWSGPSNQIGAAGLAALASSSHLGALEELNVSGNQIGPEGGRALAQGRGLKSLHTLDLSYNDLGASGLTALASSGLMRRLRSLEMQANEVGREGARALAESPHAARLEVLDLSGSLHWSRPLLDDAAARALASSPHLGRVRRLVLKVNEIGPAGAAALARSTTLRSLRWLLMPNNHVGDRGARALAESELIGQLEVLDLGANQLTDRGGRALARSTRASPGLQLWLSNHHFSDAVRAALEGRYGSGLDITSPEAEDEEEFDADWE